MTNTWRDSIILSSLLAHEQLIRLTHIPHVFSEGEMLFHKTELARFDFYVDSLLDGDHIFDCHEEFSRMLQYILTLLPTSARSLSHLGMIVFQPNGEGSEEWTFTQAISYIQHELN